MARLFLTLSLLANLGCQASLPTGFGGLPGVATSLSDFERRLDSVRVLLRVPGLSAAIGKNGRIAWSRGFGFADLSTARPVIPETTFHIASLTKLFGATVLLRLVDSGLVGLDDPISQYGVSLPSKGTIRVRHLLSMTSGDPAPGERFAYDGDRFALLGTVIQRASGQPFEELVTRWILRPLALEHTAPNVDNAAFASTGQDAAVYRAGMAKPYAITNGMLALAQYPTLFSVAAGLISTPNDLLRFVQALDSGGVLSHAMRELMVTPARNSSGQVLPYAFGCFSQQYRGVRIVWAYGYWTANSALLISVPERGLSFVALANADRLSAGYRLGAGLLLDSPLAKEFLNAFVFDEEVALPAARP